MTMTSEQLLDLDKLRDEDIQKLKVLEDELYSSATQAWFENPANATLEQRKDLKEKRIKLSNLIEDLDTIRIEKNFKNSKQMNQNFWKESTICQKHLKVYRVRSILLVK